MTETKLVQAPKNARHFSEPTLVPLDHLGLVRTQGILGGVERAEDHPVFARVAEWLAELR